MTHTINSNTNLLSIDVTRTHTQMRKSPRGEKESRKEMRRDKELKKRRGKIGIKESVNVPVIRKCK